MAHIHEKVDFTVFVMIVYKNKVLLRMHDKYHFWAAPGGHIELDEDPIQTVLREAKEETGLDIVIWDGTQKLKMNNEYGNELIPPVGINRHFVTAEKTHEHINMVYIATAKTDALHPAPNEQQDGLQWCTKEDLQTMDLRTDIKFYAELALDTLGS
jgi:8-oxo-dGTP pyrophosphatase MutT (NUDIX family)